MSDFVMGLAAGVTLGAVTTLVLIGLTKPSQDKD